MKADITVAYGACTAQIFDSGLYVNGQNVADLDRSYDTLKALAILMAALEAAADDDE